jgi:phosphoribosylformylglycinamidine cyclo-ligase
MVKDAYRGAGVNVELGDDVSKMLYEAARQTWKNRDGRLGELIVPFDDFSGVRAINVGGLPESTLMNFGFDGVGTKMELAERVEDHSTIAYDLFAMVCDDAVVRGAEPVLIGSILDVNSLEGNMDYVRQLAEGYIGAANDAGVAVVNGEVAELGERVSGYGKFSYNWGASVVWFADKNRLFTGKEVKEGDSIIGFREAGFRSNGLSLVRKIMHDRSGDDWHTLGRNGCPDLEMVDARKILTPSQIYTAAVVNMFGGYDGDPKVEVHGVSHITGGGLPGKLGRVLKPSGFGAAIDDPFQPSEIMSYVQSIGDVSDRDAYSTWNMGQGMVVISPDPKEVVRIAKDHGIDAKKIGYVDSDPSVRIMSNGVERPGTYVNF